MTSDPNLQVVMRHGHEMGIGATVAWYDRCFWDNDVPKGMIISAAASSSSKRRSRPSVTVDVTMYVVGTIHSE